ncbi:2-C-methyl-D-erythritol 4-phosphate cytidylyltransferase [Treponema bryantii]|uniref:Ribitol-5-phosphate cytidylyltransferase n=1 Tax=Treponema bryantii TaxID=163 RepID=A0A1H9G8Q7_9SPIR|nr:2-C-methyl-D-erythritol 4-phosphate cytidylyltransferase [Treponema bryantii]SEQ46469.1 2-C-methyl-D-erythritol 4-phosphate cytidylyltransferase [Treponema bryantii]
MNNALIFAGGSGTRMNSRAKPKQFLQFYGKELIIHTLENFQNHPEIDNIVIVCIEDWIPFLNKLLDKYQIDKVRKVVPGGSSGQESIYNGLCAIKEFAPDDSVVLVHDGVRPFVNENIISECITSVKEHGSAITVTPAIETIATITDGKITSITDRSKCFHAKAPQCFVMGELLAAHEKARKEGNTNMIDSASLMKYYGHDLYTVQGNFDNIKITTPADFYTFKALYEVREQQQIFGL